MEEISIVSRLRVHGIVVVNGIFMSSERLTCGGEHGCGRSCNPNSRNFCKLEDGIRRILS
jgi:hypothetical protein